MPVVPQVKELMCNKQKAAGDVSAYLKQYNDIREIRGKNSVVVHLGKMGSNVFEDWWQALETYNLRKNNQQILYHHNKIHFPRLRWLICYL